MYEFCQYTKVAYKTQRKMLNCLRVASTLD